MIFFDLFTRLLRKLPPEWAHHVAILCLRIKQRIWHRWLGHKVTVLPRISTPCGLQVSKRLGLAAGFDKNAEALVSLASLGFGFLEVGTVTPQPQEGNSKPRLFRESNQTLVNRMGFNNCGVEQFRANLRKLKPLVSGISILANVGKGKLTPLEKAIEDYALLFDALKNEVDGFVVNISSPNTPSLVYLQNRDFIESLNHAAQRLPPALPVWVKFSPDLEENEWLKILQAINGTRLNGVVVTNTSRALAEKKYPEGGGLSGPPLFEKSLRWVKLARETLRSDITVVGVGGISNPSDAIRMREAGADLVEIYTAFVYQGPRLVDRIGRSLLS